MTKVMGFRLGFFVTALVILATGAHELGLEGAAITQEGFNIAFGPYEDFFFHCRKKEVLYYIFIIIINVKGSS